MHEAFVYWLLSEEKARAHFARIIGELSERFDAPVFEPHLTLLVAPATLHAPGEILRGIASPKIALSVDRVATSDRFTKTSFVRFRKKTELQELADTVVRACGLPAQRVADPHVSLLYANVDGETRRTLADTITLPFAEVFFDALCVMRCALTVAIGEAMRAWERVAFST
ncbi:MAG: hypothetical protein M3R59_06105 [Verrucomicrobiota bacterium]|nr:hypothetical protein [Verrucomicrobiota bacterium]